MRGLFRSAAFRRSAIFWILSALAAHQGWHRGEQYRQAGRELQAARQHSMSADGELAKFKRLIAAVPQPDSASGPIQEHLALLLLRLRKAESVTRVTIQNLAAEGRPAEKREAAGLLQPIASFPGAGSISVAVEGSYLTRSGLEEFLATGRGAGASLTALAIQDRRFQAGFRLYGRL